MSKGIIARKAKDIEIIPAGNYFARCYCMIEYGHIMESFQGKDPELKHKVRIIWELPTETYAFKEGDDPRPRSIGEEYTISLSTKANLRKVIESWRGKALTNKEADEFDITKLLGKSCLINIVHTEGKAGTKSAGKFFTKIAGVSPLPKGFPSHEQHYESKVFNFDENFDAGFIEGLPDFIKLKVKSSEEWKEKMANMPVAETAHVAESIPGMVEEEMPF